MLETTHRSRDSILFGRGANSTTSDRRRWAAGWIALGLLFFAAPAAEADETRFVRLVPSVAEESPAAGQVWDAVVEVKGAAKQKDKLRFWADGQPLTAEIERLDDSRLAVRLHAVPISVRRIAVGMEGKKGPEEEAAVVVGASGPEGDWTIYHIMLGYFNNANPANDGEIDGWRHANYAGGDLQGVLAKADYIASLGVDAVWLSPIFQSRTSHGYDVGNYYRLGDQFAVPDDPVASLALFRQVRDALHERGVRVILDLPLNHASKSYDKETGDPEGLKPKATTARQEAEKVWESWGANFRYWNFDHQPTRKFLEEVALYWLVDEKVDGLRLDYVRGVPHDFWADLTARVRAVKPEALLLGECWIDDAGAESNAKEIARYYAPVATEGEPRPQLDVLLDFPLQIGMTDVFARGGEAERLEELLQQSHALYGPGALPGYFLDNHDMSRFLAWTQDSGAVVAALAFAAAQSSPLIVFYGTETGLADASPKPGFVDSGRIPMPWDSLDEPLIERIRQVLRARAEYDALSRGGRLPLSADDDTLLMAKVYTDQVFLVAVNRSDESREVAVDLGVLAESDSTFEAVLGSTAPERGEDGALGWRISPQSTAISRLVR